MHKLSALESSLHASPLRPSLLGAFSLFLSNSGRSERERSVPGPDVCSSWEEMFPQDFPLKICPSCQSLLLWSEPCSCYLGCGGGREDAAQGREQKPEGWHQNYMSSRGLSSDSFAERTTGCFSESLLEGDFASWRSLV